MNIVISTMVRNEIDIIADFIGCGLDLADTLLVADMQSSDGTREVVDAYAASTGAIECFSVSYSGRYQSETLTALSKKAIDQGADWVFFLDADEFLRAESRAMLEEYLHSFGSQVMHLPWLNLVPTNYGSFRDFSASQEFYWSGRTSHFKKVAISAQYAISHPDYVVEPGSHNVKSNAVAKPEETQLGIPLMHIQVRSVERIQYKASNALEIARHKHNQRPGDSSHHQPILDAIAGKTIDKELMNGIAQDYGSKEPIKPCHPAELGWPKLTLTVPRHNHCSPTKLGLNAAELRRVDKNKLWKRIELPSDANVCATLKGNEVVLLPQTMRGDGANGPTFFQPLEPNDKERAGRLTTDTLVSALEASLMAPPFPVFSAWTDLVPVLAALFVIARPRRYVDLGVHNGMSFFSACQASDQLQLNCECVAIDSWEGDAHAGFHDATVFNQFTENLKSTFPEQYYLKSYFDEAAPIFDTKSIDLLHIDGFHSYEAVQHDFRTWLPKMSDRAIVIFHDINVHERGFGVWRFWEEVANKFPSAAMDHGHGLGILYVGDQDSGLAEIFDLLRSHPNIERLIKHYFETLVESSKLRKPHNSDKPSARLPSKLNYSDAVLISQLNSIAEDKWWLRTAPLRRLSNAIRKLRGRPKKVWPSPIK
ncbi:MAG: class I SAM-dependent methyltransferase [Hyphomicrobiaceae bacterium]